MGILDLLASQLERGFDIHGRPKFPTTPTPDYTGPPRCDLCGRSPATEFTSSYNHRYALCAECGVRESGTYPAGGPADSAAGTDVRTKSSAPANSEVTLPDDVTHAVSNRTDLGRIADALEKLVSLKLYELKVPLPEVYAADPSGMVEAAILALAKEEMGRRAGASVEDLRQKLVDSGVEIADPQLWDTGAVGRTGSSQMDDVLFYDHVRRMATYLNLPFDDLTDLEEMARQHQWTRDTIEETLRGIGLED